MRTLAVVGGGVIGSSVAWRAAESGWAVTIFDPAPGSGASWVAGGMLAPLSEAWPGEGEALEFGAASLDRWPGFGARIQAVTGTSVFVAEETLTVALDAADAADLRTIAEFVGEHRVAAVEGGASGGQAGAGGDPGTSQAPHAAAPGRPEGLGPRTHALRLLDRTQVRAAEPGLARTVRAGLLASTEPAVDNRLLVGALRQCCEQVGVHNRAEAVTDLSDLNYDRVVLAAGASAARLWPGLAVRPVKGEILRLRHRPGAPPPPRRVIRARVHGRPMYLVPRADGIVVGATQYEAGFDTAVTVAGVRDLIADAEAVLPALGEYELAEAAAGSRPATPDNLPLIGRLNERVVVAAGHGRNGILGVPLTVDAVLALLGDGDVPAAAKFADPARFPQNLGATAVAASSTGGIR
ncbi:glycine oxidase [Nocardia sp. GAS34]|uniref:FAD-dependent oxidoreductase n=1 Tax=unclassified Nocardia TaxID=2637762 RepID=UPI003D2123A3